nr:hypothetical protein [Tanacetum cinerariifolium]
MSTCNDKNQLKKPEQMPERIPLPTDAKEREMIRKATGCKENNYSIVVHDGQCRCGCNKDYVDTSYLDLGCGGVN